MWSPLIEIINTGTLITDGLDIIDILVMECGILTSFHNVKKYCDIANGNDLLVSDRCLHIKQDGCVHLSSVVKFCFLTWLLDDKRNTTAKVNQL